MLKLTDLGIAGKQQWHVSYTEACRFWTYLLPKGLTLSFAQTRSAMMRIDELLASRISKTGIFSLPRILAKVSMDARKTELQAYEANPRILRSGL